MFQILWIFLPLLSILNCPCHVHGGYRKNYVVERNESWNGHVYLVREEQPFFRVYHQTHTKVVLTQNPLMAAEFWREHNKAGHQRNRRADPSMDWAVDEKAMGAANDLTKATKGHRNDHGFMGREGVEHPMEEMPTGSQSPPLLNASLEHQQEELELKVLERNQNRSSAKFGHHHLPTGERKDSVNWPWQLFPYMHCLSMECICPLFRGKMRGNRCILANGKPLERAVRKEFRQYTREELALFMEVMHRFKSSGLYSRLGMIHRRSGVHSGPSFFPWHREFLKRLEIVFRALHPENSVPTLGLPYWDSSLDGDLPAPEDSIMFSQMLLGEPDESGFVTTGLFANWTTMDGRHSFQRMFGDQPDGEFFNEARIDFVLSQTQVDRVMAFSLPLQSCLNYEMDDRFLEYSHDYVHYFISGDMQERFSSSNDPIFFMHHGFVDSVWEMWRQKRQSRLQRERDYPRDDGECMPEWHYSYAYMPLLQPLRNMDALSNNYTDNMYEYAPRPSCAKTGRSEECGNTEFLWCDTKSHAGNPVCSAKVKPGGNCRGFEWSSEVCYQGQCLDGRCSRPLVETQRTKMDASWGWQPDSFMRK